MMTFRELKQAVTEAGDVGMTLRLADGSHAPAHFHITEVASVTRDFIDCGGARRTEGSCVLQTYVAGDFAHRLRTGKFLKILEASSSFMTDEDALVEFDYQEGSIVRYALGALEVEDGDAPRLVISLESMQTDCLAKDKCGISPEEAAVQIISTTDGGTLDIGGVKGASWGST